MFSNAEQCASGKFVKIQAGSGDVFTKVTRLDVIPVLIEMVKCLLGDEVNLAHVWREWIYCHSRAMFDGWSRMCVAFNAKTRNERNRIDGKLRERMLWRNVKSFDY